MKTYKVRIYKDVTMTIHLCDEYIEAASYMQAIMQLREMHPYGNFSLMSVSACEVCE